MAIEFEVMYGDILGLDVEAIVAPEIGHASSVRCPLTARIYDEADYMEMICACGNEPIYEKKMHDPVLPRYLDPDDPDDAAEFWEIHNEAELHSDMFVTSGFNLRAEYVIHLEIYEECWQKGQNDFDRYHKEATIQNCYIDTLDVVKENDVHSIAFPVLGTCFLGFPEELARHIGECAIAAWCNDTPQINDEYDLKIYLVVPYTSKRNPIPTPPTPAVGAYDKGDVFFEYQKKLAEKIENSGMDKESFYKKTVYDYLNRIPTTDCKFCEPLGFGSEVLTRFRNKQIGSEKGGGAKKWRVIAMAIELGLDDYERFEFINCSKNKYPANNLDFQVEMILRSGITCFEAVNEKLIAIDPEYDLTKPAKKTGERRR